MNCCDDNNKDNNNGIDLRGLPPIMLYSLFILKQLGRTPRSPQDSHLQVDHKYVDREKSVVIFFSHNWQRGWPGAKDYNVVVPPLDTPKPHPDTANHDKFKLLIKAIDHMKKAYFPDIDEENIYVWIDYGCINQDVAACDELKMLDKIMGVCDLMVTTIYDDNWSREWYDKLQVNGITDIFKEYGSPAWNQGDHSYLKRAWCLVEMMYASNIPLVTSSAKRLSMFRGVLLTCIEQNRRPHLLMGTNELERNLPPIVLPPLRSKYFLENDPRKGKLTVEGDRITICGLADMLTIEMVDETYEGGRNEKGQPHGQGTYTLADGSEYQGEWKDGKRHGQGTYTFANGSKYQGEFKDGDFNGEGIKTLADGSIAHYGEWKDDQPVGKSYPRDEYGWITKRGHMYPSWKKRYFRLKMGVLEYYTEESCKAECLKGSFNIAGYNIDTSTPVQIYISSSSRSSVLGGSKDMYMKFDNEGDKERWLKALQASV